MKTLWCAPQSFVSLFTLAKSPDISSDFCQTKSCYMETLRPGLYNFQSTTWVLIRFSLIWQCLTWFIVGWNCEELRTTHSLVRKTHKKAKVVFYYKLFADSKTNKTVLSVVFFISSRREHSLVSEVVRGLKHTDKSICYQSDRNICTHLMFINKV